MREIADEIIDRILADSASEPVITVIGDLNYDYLFSAPPLERGKEVLITSHTRSLAGAAGVVSCGLAKLGAKVFFITAPGSGRESRTLFHEVRKRGVVCKRVRPQKDSQGAYTLIFTQEGETWPRQVATFQGSLEHFSVKDFNYMRYVAKSSALYSCNYFIMPRLREEIGEIFAEARRKRVITAYDANAGDRWEEKEALKTLTNSIFPLTDIVFLNESEAYSLTGKKNPIQSIEKLCQEALVIVVKRGPKGVVYRHAGRTGMVGSFPIKSRIRDTVGAGDSFQACFLYFYMKKYPVLFSLVLGSANAASTLLYPGGTEGQRNRDELVSLLRKYSISCTEKGDVSIHFKS
jgi:sugar/nucleoside kinase (ribokinase family)